MDAHRRLCTTYGKKRLLHVEKVKTMTETCMSGLEAVILLYSQFIQYFYAF